ncbi:MAG: SMI1/KNR4 family protein [Polyangiaceae bacterium]|nr:SMI1/KNR4 family protein [Polyangiaceae bacterium]
MPELVEGVWRPCRGAGRDDLDALQRAAPFTLPRSYLDQLAMSNGGEGSLTVQPWWIVFWEAESVIESNADYELSKHLPGFFGFASSGGGELLAFDARGREPFPIVAIPFIPLDATLAILVARNFDELKGMIGKPYLEG